jgi:cellulose synthase/poly-beta-1,6-N-acetylglucosamine synthase-like glycosyltransferase
MPGELLSTASWMLLLLCIVPLLYMYLLAAASMRGARPPAVPAQHEPTRRFAITIPAHDEETVIAATVSRLMQLDYPRHLFSVHVVADYCSDNTAALARQAGAQVHERNEGPRTGKGAALSWLFQRVLAGDTCDAVVIFDSDTRVHVAFLRVMDTRLAQGAAVVQGQHIISNPEDGWFPALTWAMFLIDNRFQNLGRSNLGWSAKHMGDSICFRADVLREFGWGQGLTEDFELRQRLLLGGIRIVYEPEAKGYGEATPTWQQARVQRARWLRGVHDASRLSARQLIVEALRRFDGALLDGALQAYLPSFSTLTLISISVLLVQLAVNAMARPVFSGSVLAAWATVIALLFIYPMIGLALERAPARAYGAILLGPFFVLWRSWLALTSRYGRKPIRWIRTAHGGKT